MLINLPETPNCENDSEGGLKPTVKSAQIAGPK